MAKISPSPNLPEARTPDMVMGSTNGTPPLPPTRNSPPSPPGEHSLPLDRHPQPAGPGSPQGKEGTTTQDYVPDKPLDLSERGRCRASAPKPANQSGSLSPPRAPTPSPEPPQGVGPPAQCGAQRLSNGTQEAREPEAKEHPPSPPVPEGKPAAQVTSHGESADPPAPPCPGPPQAVPEAGWGRGREVALHELKSLPSRQDAPYSAPGPHLSLPSPSGPGEEDRGRPKLPPYPPRPGGDGHPGLGDPHHDHTPTPQMGLSTRAEATQSSPGEGPGCICNKECGRGPQKRKRASDPWSK
ncbi:hypothetical protein Celaphus_00007760, partial [Cervus elaphus hippelaphus]